MPGSPLPRLSRRRPGVLGAALILLALWIQVLAPGVTLRMSTAAAEALPGAILCGHGPDRSDAGDSVERPTPAPTCALCHLCCAGLASPFVPEPPVLARPLHWIPVAWPMPQPAGPEPSPPITNRPRGTSRNLV